MGRGYAPWGTLLLLCLSLCMHSAHAQDQGSATVVTTGQAFANQVASWGLEGGTHTLLIATPLLSLSLASTTFTNFTTQPAAGSTSPFSSGVLTIIGTAPPDNLIQPSPIIDAQQRTGLVPRMAGATIVMNNITMINVCSKVYEASVILGPLASLTSALEGGLFQRTRVYQSFLYNDYTLYVRSPDLSQQTYLLLVRQAAINFPPMEAVTREFLIAAPMAPANVTWMTAYAAHVTTFSAVSARWQNSMIKAIEDMNDPQTRRLHDLGLVMRPAYCNGTLLPPEIAAARVYNTTPAFLTSDKAEFLTSLRDAIRFHYSKPANAWRAPTLVVMTQDAPLSTDDLSTPLPVLDFVVLVTGPFNHHPAYVFVPTLHVGGARDWLTIQPGGALCLQRLTLAGLAQQPNPLVPDLYSALPLSGLSLSNSSAFNISQPYLWLINVTLVLPTNDFLSLAVLALNGTDRCVSNLVTPDISQRAAQLRTGILNITLLRGDDARGAQQDASVHLASFVGWGLNATRIQFVPDRPIQQLTACRSGNVAETDTSGTSVSKSRVILISCLVSVGALIALSVAAWLFFRFRRRQGNARSEDKGSLYSRSEGSRASSGIPPARGQGSTQAGSTSAATPSSALVTLLTELNITKQLQPDGLPAKTRSSRGSSNDPQNRISAGTVQFVPITDAQKLEPDLEVAPPGSGEQLHHSSVLLSGRDFQQHIGQVQQLAAGINHNPDKVIIQGVLGQGSWGSVYVAEWRGLPVAVKTIVFEERSDSYRPGKGGNKGVVPQHQAVTEAAIAASLGHRNVVSTYLYDVKPVYTLEEASVIQGLQVYETSASTPGHSQQVNHDAYKLFLVQELCCTALNKVLQSKTLINPSNNVVDLAAVYSILLDIACGLEYLHSKDIVHGDLKPANVLLKLDADSPCLVVAKLADFGLSVHLTADRTHVSNFTSGTPFYVAPEVVSHNRLGKPADVFSFGVMMWQIYTSIPPYIKLGDGGFKWNPGFGSFKDVTPPRRQYIQLMRMCLADKPSERPNPADIITVITALQEQEPGQQSHGPVLPPSTSKSAQQV